MAALEALYNGVTLKSPPAPPSTHCRELDSLMEMEFNCDLKRCTGTKEGLIYFRQCGGEYVVCLYYDFGL